MDWIESNNLFLHDIALLIENTEKKVYFYAGPKSAKKDHELGKQLAQNIVKKFGYDFIILDTAVPLAIQKEIDLLLGENIDPKAYKEERTILMQLFVILGFLGSLTLLALLINNLRMFGWRISLLTYGTTLDSYNELFRISRITLYVAFGLIISQFLCSLFTKRIFLIISSFALILIIGGIYYYLLEGTGLFQRAPEEIRRSELLLHTLWLLIAIGGFLGFIVWSSIVIFKHTEIKPKMRISLEEQRRASHPTILRDKAPVELKEIKRE
ncbi:MAG: hypothetical protein K9W44_05135 [Candidatus Lokiarchaeota archaeon]|nr:hypothetical protein [Candidatus Harpocratesius repetitus]